MTNLCSFLFCMPLVVWICCRVPMFMQYALFVRWCWEFEIRISCSTKVKWYTYFFWRIRGRIYITWPMTAPLVINPRLSWLFTVPNVITEFYCLVWFTVSIFIIVFIMKIVEYMSNRSNDNRLNFFLQKLSFVDLKRSLNGKLSMYHLTNIYVLKGKLILYANSMKAWS
jgi:hypothetical protein